MPTSETVVVLEGVNGETFNLTTGDQGIYLATDPKGLYDPKVKTVYEEPGNWPGARYLGHRILRRDITFGVEILNDVEEGADKSWLARDSKWRKAWSFKRDCTLSITTPESGTRKLKLRLGDDGITVEMFTDPNGEVIKRAVMTCVAGDPFWYGEDLVKTATTLTDTTFDPAPLPWPWPQNAIPTETLTITVDAGDGGVNPTNEAVFIKWQVPGSTEAPAELYVPGVPWLGAPDSPATIWTLPDYSFGDLEQDPDLENENRRLQLPPLIGGLRVNEVQVVTLSGLPTGGNFKLTFSGQETADIAYNASAATVKSALEALSNIAVDDVTVSKSTANSLTRYTVTFQQAFEGIDVPTMTVTNTLTGGTTPWAVVATSVEGDTLPAENCVIDTDPRVEQVVSENGSQVWSRMNGVRFRHYVPPYTESHTFTITVSGTPAGQMVSMRIPRPWTRPWGLE